MRFRWLLNNFVDPHVHLTIRERRDTERIARERCGTRWFGLSIVGASGISAALLVFAVKPAAAAVFGTTDTAALTLLCVVALLANWILLTWLKGSLLTRPFRRALRDKGVRLCVGCGYLMDGVSQPGVCPECGEREPDATESTRTRPRRVETRSSNNAEQGDDG